MPTLSRSRTSQICFLQETGEISVAGSRAPASPTASSTIVLSRALCRFEFIPRPAGLSAANALRAARLLADSKSPFTHADSAVISGKRGHGIWWWDTARIVAMLGGSWSYRTDKVVPESLLQPPGKYFRQIELRDGFEAQFWDEEGTLVQSSWRRNTFTTAQWTAFARAADPTVGAESVEPPIASSLPMALSGAARVSRGVAPRDAWQQLERGALLAMVFCILTSAALVGRAVGYAGVADSEAAEAASLAAPSAMATAKGDAELEIALAKRFSDLQSRPSPLLAAAEIHQLLAKRGAKVVEFSIDKDQLEVQLQPPPDSSLKDIASDIEASPVFAGVDPEFDNAIGLGRIIATVCVPSSAKDADMQCLRARANR